MNEGTDRWVIFGEAVDDGLLPQLEMGPASRNIAGARRAAERIVMSAKGPRAWR